MGISTYAMGFAARQQGTKKEDNPFGKTDEWHEDWTRGWEDADKEKQKKVKKIIPVMLIKA